jgi:ATP-dependent Clp protease ATP-binding subunit ClpC
MLIIDTHSKRVKKEKIANLFANQTINLVIVSTTLILAILGLYLYATGSNLGWLLFIPLVFMFMMHEWYMYDLRNLKPSVNSILPSDILNAGILGNFENDQPTVADIVNAISKSSGRNFFRNRFLIDDSLLNIADISDMAKTWDVATELWQKNKLTDGVGGAHLTVAILFTANNKQEILRAINYSEAEILNGLAWYVYLINALESIKQKKSSGGIARDWASGYTPLLTKYAQNISYSIQYGGTTHRDIFSRQKVVNEMVSIFSGAGRANVALVGQAGTGKHICVQGLADELIFGSVTGSLKYAQIYQIDISMLLSTVKQSYLENVLNQILSEAYHAKNIILFFNNAGQLFGSDDLVDLSNFLQPIIEAGRLRAIYSFTDVQWQYLQRNKPALSAIFNYQAVMPTDEAETISILENEAIFVEHKYKCLFTYESLKEIYRLASRYGPDVAMPSKAISVMESAGRTGSGSLISSQTVQNAIESSTGIKVGLAVGAEKDKLLNLENTIKQRVIGQDIAVTAVVSALKRNRSGVANSDRPIGTFLFLGPTGVGKTELSKALASAYFGEDDRFIRLDMNEFITNDSINRLLATGNQLSPTFIDRIKLQPFAVVLLDEIEKAHPDIINIFLQVLDEGVLVDSDNRQISFKDTIIIATSNAGADLIRQQVTDDTTNDSLTTEVLLDNIIRQGIFKPEFVNRFDETIMFRPLTSKQLEQVVLVLLSQINKELANRKITVKLESTAIEWLSINGYDPAMGARPLRRLMQKTIENIVADKILADQIQPGDEIVITGQDLATHTGTLTQ